MGREAIDKSAVAIFEDHITIGCSQSPINPALAEPCVIRESNELMKRVAEGGITVF